MRKAILTLAVVFAPAILWAGVLHFEKAVDGPALAVELKAATGLSFERECLEGCLQTGWVVADDHEVFVGVFDALDPEKPWISSATWTQDLQDEITAVVESHTP